MSSFGTLSRRPCCPSLSLLGLCHESPPAAACSLCSEGPLRRQPHTCLLGGDTPEPAPPPHRYFCRTILPTILHASHPHPAHCTCPKSTSINTVASAGLPCAQHLPLVPCPPPRPGSACHPRRAGRSPSPYPPFCVAGQLSRRDRTWGAGSQPPWLSACFGFRIRWRSAGPHSRAGPCISRAAPASTTFCDFYFHCCSFLETYPEPAGREQPSCSTRSASLWTPPRAVH